MSPSIAGATTTGADVARTGRGHDVAGQAVGHRAEPVRRRRRHDDRVGRVADDDVADPAVRQEVEQLGLDRVARQRRERQRTDEAGRGRGQHDRHVGALGAQEAEQLDGLVGGDRAGHAKADEAPGQRPPPPSSVPVTQPQFERLAAADLGVQDGQALERQVGVDGVDALERARPGRGGQAAGQDRPDVGRGDAVGIGQLGRTRSSRPAARAW